MDRYQSACKIQKHFSTASSVRLVSASMRRVQIVYYLSYGGGFLEHPHLLEVSTSSSTGLCLKDVKKSLASLRGSGMLSSFSWSYKRNYKQGYVWQDLESDNDLIFPAHGGSEYILKGCKIESSCTLTTSAFPPTESVGSAILHSVNDVSTAMEPLITKVAELASDEKANKNTVESSSSASLHVCKDTLIVSPAIIEGLDHLRLNQKNDLHYELYAESEASTSLDHINALEQTKLSKHECVSQQSYFEELALKGKTVPYGSEFRILTKDGCVGTSFNSSQYVVADAATQTGEDDGLPIQHIKSILTCPSNCFNPSHHKLPFPILQAARSRARTTREEMFKHKVITQNLSREEISPPPCSTSSSTITTAYSSASSDTVGRCKIDHRAKLSFDQSAKDQMFQEKNPLLSSRGLQSKENAHSEKPESAMIGLAQGIYNDDNPCCRLITSSISEELDQKSCTDDVDYSCQKSKLTSDSTDIKPYPEMSIFSSSGRFLRLVSCGGGLEVIRSTQRSSNKSSREHVGDREESSSGAAKNAKDDSPCMHTSVANAKNNALAIGSSLPYVANDVLSAGYLSVFNGDNETVFAAQEARTSNNKKLWHLKGWVNYHYKKIKSIKGGIKGSSTTFATIDDSYACLDLFETHERRNSSIDHVNVEERSSQSRLIRAGRAAYTSSLHHR